MIKRYIIRPTVPVQSDKKYWIIIASDMQSAWRKFVTQHFGPMKPNPSEWDISLHSYM